MDKSTDRKYLIKAFAFLVIFIFLFYFPARTMGLANMLNTMMNTAFRLLLDTCLYIMAIAVLAGAISSLFAEFGVIELINKLLSPLMKPFWGLPGAAALGVVTTYLSDNPAILALAEDKRYRKFFKAYQIPALTNIGTAFGMGLIVSSYMIVLSGQMGMNLGWPVLCGNIGAVVGSIVSTRLMLVSAKKKYGKDMLATEMPGATVSEEIAKETPPQGMFLRIIDSLLKGGKSGVDLGLGIIPGVLVICTLVMMLTNGPSESGAYTGAAFEGVRVLPWIGDKLNFILTPLFGFSSSECLAVPITALGSAGAAVGIAKGLAVKGAITGGDIAVFTAMCMCWSGYLSTHVSMMDVLNCRELAGKSILFHTIGGLVAGVAAHFLYILF